MGESMWSSFYAMPESPIFRSLSGALWQQTHKLLLCRDVLTSDHRIKEKNTRDIPIFSVINANKVL